MFQVRKFTTVRRSLSKCIRGRPAERKTDNPVQDHLKDRERNGQTIPELILDRRIPADGINLMGRRIRRPLMADSRIVVAYRETR